MKTIKLELPEHLIEQLEVLVGEGWFPNRDEIVRQALEKFLNVNRPETLEKHIRQDAEWALHGST